MKTPILTPIAQAAIALTFLLAFPSAALAYSPQPDLTVAGAIAALKADPNASRKYSETYNLGATGLRGWIYITPTTRVSKGSSPRRVAKF